MRLNLPSSCISRYHNFANYEIAGIFLVSSTFIIAFVKHKASISSSNVTLIFYFDVIIFICFFTNPFRRIFKIFIFSFSQNKWFIITTILTFFSITLQMCKTFYQRSIYFLSEISYPESSEEISKLLLTYLLICSFYNLLEFF